MSSNFDHDILRPTDVLNLSLIETTLLDECKGLKGVGAIRLLVQCKSSLTRAIQLSTFTGHEPILHKLAKFSNTTDLMAASTRVMSFISPTKTTEETHRDPFHNTVVVLCGCKYFYTVPHWVEHSKRNYIPELNLQISPELFELHILKSGDRLTVPMGVPHFVVSDRQTMSLSFQTWPWDVYKYGDIRCLKSLLVKTWNISKRDVLKRR